MTDDLISRQAAIDLFPNDVLEWDTFDGYIAPHETRRLIEDLPTVDAVPVIRCRVCLKKRICSLYREANQENGFCAWGAKEEE